MAEESWEEVDQGAATLYEETLVPAVFEDWAPKMLTFGAVVDGDRVLDVACGTGVVARHARVRVGSNGSVVGLDLVSAMLGVARRIDPEVRWCQGNAMALPFVPATFDSVLCQAGLMFIPDRVRAVGEMYRVLRPGGRVAIQVFGPNPAQAAFANVIERHAGSDAAGRYRGPWSLADPDELLAIVVAGGFESAVLRVERAVARFPSLEAFLLAETETLLAGQVDVVALTADATEVLAPYVDASGELVLPGPGHVATATRH